MADTELAPDTELEPVAAPAEGGPEAETEHDATEQPENPIEALASELGWAPKDQFRGNPDDWKPADEFIRAGRDIQRNVSRELKEVRSTVENMSRTTAQILEDRLAAQRAEYEAKFKEAVDLNDPQAAFAASQKLTELQQPAHRAPTPEGENFAQRHSAWYGKNPEATDYAVARAEHYARQGLSPARQLAAVETDMKQFFPDLFPAPAKTAPAVRQPQSRTASASARAKGFHDLPAEAQKVAKDMAERGVIPSVDVYAAKFFESERKVG